MKSNSNSNNLVSEIKHLENVKISLEDEIEEFKNGLDCK